MAFHSGIDIVQINVLQGLCIGGNSPSLVSAKWSKRKTGKAKSEDVPGSVHWFGRLPAYSHTLFADAPLMKGAHRITTRRRKVRARRVSYNKASNRGLEV